LTKPILEESLGMTLLFLSVVLGAYLVGSIPFGWIVATAKGIDIRQHGSGNIGATNVGRILGRKWGLLVFVLDFAKGAGPVFLAGFLPTSEELQPMPDTWRVLAGTCAFIGHMLPVWLRFAGGKGVATGAGVIFVLVPLITLLVLATWGLTRLVSGIVSLASIVAVVVLMVLRLVFVPEPFGSKQLLVTLFCLLGSLLVIVRHRSNIARLIAGTEGKSTSIKQDEGK
jgi:acyl-phosphate glycerol 3-phosphate acyltransferase